MKPTSRAEAKKLGLKRYFTGKPCKRGHVASRLASDGGCSVCNAASTKDYAKANREKTLAASKKWREANPQKAKDSKKKWILKNKNKKLASHYARRTRFRYSPKHEREAIRQFYLNTPEGYEVDHEIPINHKLVCGLHCIANLQYLTVEANRQKSNKWSIDE